MVNAYALLNVCIFIYFYRKYGLFNIGVILLAFYVLIAVSAIPAYKILQTDSFFSQYNFRNITLIPYIFLITITLLLIQPTFHFNKYIENTDIVLSRQKIKWFIIIYTLCSMIAIYCYYRTIVNNVSVETISEVRNDHYEGESLKAYNNFIEHLILLFVFNFNAIATIVFFYVLAHLRSHVASTWIILMAIGVVAPIFMVAIMTASRGMILTEFFQLIFCYCFFAKYYPKKLKRYFAIISIILVALFLIYSIIVTIARFGEGDDTLSSLISYFGQPTIIFNSKTAEIADFACGNYFFYPWVKYLGGNPDRVLISITKSWSPCFNTIVGNLYVDFGPIGTFLIALIVPVVFQNYLMSPL